MVHTYRDNRPVGEHRLVALLATALGLAVFVLPVGWGIVAAVADGAIWQGVGLATFAMFVAVWMYKSRQRECLEIRLSDEGTCELETRRRVIRLHVNEISAVEYDDDDESVDSYTIRFTCGKTVVREWLGEFPDFFARLQALNPAVDLSSVPGAWPNREAEAPGTRVLPFLASALFPVAVIIFIALIAWHTLS